MEEFEIIRSAIFEKYNEGKYLESLKLVNEASSIYSDQDDSILYWKACFYSLLGQSKNAIDALKAAYDKGIWWSPRQFESDPDLDNLRNEGEFIIIKNKMEEKYRKASIDAEMEMVIEERDESEGYLLNLHWKNDNIEHYRKFFTHSLDAIGIGAIYVQSSQIMSSRGYCWDDKAIAQSEVEKAIVNKVNKIRAMCGYSQGANIALMMSIKYEKDYIGIMPALRDTTIAKMIINQKAKYRFVVGELDPFYKACQENLRYLVERGFDAKLINLGNIGHSFDRNFDLKFETTLQDILSQ